MFIDTEMRVREIDGGVPVVAYPRFGWVPIVGKWLARLLPRKKYKGRVIGVVDWFGFLRRFQELGDDRVDEMTIEEIQARGKKRAELTNDFLAACGLPVKRTLRLPGSVVEEIVSSFFLTNMRAHSGGKGATKPGRNGRRSQRKATAPHEVSPSLGPRRMTTTKS